MTINLIIYASSLDNLPSIGLDHQNLLNELELQFKIKYFKHTDLEDIPKEEFSVIFLATGGIEQLVAQDIEKLPRPIVLLADGLHNSLASALEISTWLRERGIKNEILHGDINIIKRRLFTLGTNFHAQHRLKQQRIGILGTPTPWLIASDVDYFLAKQRWGIDFINYPLQRVYDIFDSITDDEVSNECTEFLANASACHGSNPQALIRSMRFYKAVKQLCDEDKLDGITLNCYKTLKDIKTTGCVANSLLNSEGIIAGCEGDLQALFTMIMLKSLTGETGFMCNPIRVDIENDKIILGHCSIAINQVNQYIVRDHFSSKNSLSVQGILPLGEATLVKCGGECLDEFFVTSGSIIENTSTGTDSRTEVLFKLDSSASYFLNNPLGNHHVMIRGNFEKEINSFLQTYSCRRVK